MTGRARDLGIRSAPRARPLNAITDVPACASVTGRRARRGRRPARARTGVTAIFRRGYRWTTTSTRAHILNGYGEMIASTRSGSGRADEPIVLLSLQIGKAYDATVRWIATHDPRGVMPVVSECDDSFCRNRSRSPLRRDVAARSTRRPARAGGERRRGHGDALLRIQGGSDGSGSS